MSGETERRRALLACAAIVAIGTALRLPPLFNDLWLDEVWTWFSARKLTSPVEVFTAIHHSNNNHLNTLFFQLLGEHWPGAVYRLPAFASGVGGLVLAVAIAWRRSPLEAVFAAILSASCFALLHYASEARGYAPAVFCALAAYALLERFLASGGRGAALAFGVVSSLGVLAHLVFSFFLAGAAVYAALRLIVRERLAGPGVVRLAQLFALPALTLAALYAADLRHMKVAGGSPTPIEQVVARTVGFSLGLPVVNALALPYAALAGGLVTAGLVARRREGDDAWVLFALTIAVAPIGVIGWMQPDVVAVRYFLIGIAFALLLFAGLLAGAWRSGPAGRALAALALAGFVAGNALHTARFLAEGRGGYRAALRFMADASPGARIEVGSDHDLRVGMVIHYHAHDLPPGAGLVYYRRDQRPPGGPDWLVLHRPQRPDAPAREATDAAGNRYALAAEFDHGAISGFWWGAYRNLRHGAPDD